VGANERRRGRAIVLALATTVTVSYGVLMYAFAVLLAPMQADLGLTRAEVSLAASIALAASAVAGVGVGWLMDRRDPRLVMTGGSVLATLAVLAWSRVDSAPALYAALAVLGTAMAAVTYGPAFTVLAKRFTDRRTAALTAITVAGAFASLIFSPLTDALESRLGWRDALVVLAAILAAITIPLHALVLRPAPARPRTPSVPARAALRGALFWALAAAFALGAFAWSAMVVHLVVLLVEDGHAASFAALAAGLTGLSQVAGRLLGGPVERRFGPRAALSLALALAGGALMLLAASRSTVAVLAFALLFGAGGGMQTLLSGTLPVALFGPASYGAVVGVLHACINGSRALGPLGAGVAVALAGYAEFAGVLAAALLAAAALTAPPARDRRARAARRRARPAP
jgi:MFS family permease